MNDLPRDRSRLEFRRSLTASEIDQLVDLFQAEWWTKGRTKIDVEKVLCSGGPIFAFVDPQGDEDPADGTPHVPEPRTQ